MKTYHTKSVVGIPKRYHKRSSIYSIHSRTGIILKHRKIVLVVNKTENNEKIVKGSISLEILVLLLIVLEI